MVLRILAEGLCVAIGTGLFSTVAFLGGQQLIRYLPPNLASALIVDPRQVIP